MITGREITSVFKWMMTYNFYIELTSPVLDKRRDLLTEAVKGS